MLNFASRHCGFQAVPQVAGQTESGELLRRKNLDGSNVLVWLVGALDASLIAASREGVPSQKKYSAGPRIYSSGTRHRTDAVRRQRTGINHSGARAHPGGSLRGEPACIGRRQTFNPPARSCDRIAGGAVDLRLSGKCFPVLVLACHAFGQTDSRKSTATCAKVRGPCAHAIPRPSNRRSFRRRKAAMA